MNKTPIMLLQEIMMKSGELPLYDITDEHSGTHRNSFTYTVRCKGLTANGTASSKKVAKHNAAEAMLQLLGDSPSSICIQNVSKSYNVNKILTSPPQIKDEVHCSPSRDTNFINYVGRLQELCMKYNLREPVYDIVDISGPSHLSHFTISCSIQTLQANSTSTTKKQAKQDAARKILEILLKEQHTGKANDQCTDKISEPHKYEIINQADQPNSREHQWNIEQLEALGIQITDLQINDTTSDRKVDEIKTLYKEIQKPHKIEPSQVCLQDYHTHFKQRYVVSNAIQESLLRMCNGTKNMVKEATELISREIAPTKRIHFPNQSKQHFAVGYKLESIPVIFEIGIGKTISDAEAQAVQSIIKTILLMIS